MTSRTIVRFDPKGPWGKLERMEDFPASILETNQPVQRGHLYMDDGQHGYLAGVWECTPFRSTLGRPYPFNEFMVLLEGSVTVVEPGGLETTICAGEMFAIPKGLPCQWKQSGPVRKYYVIFDDASGKELGDPAMLRIMRPDPRGQA
jgi:uncharacterized cupin superfamily protein